MGAYWCYTPLGLIIFMLIKLLKMPFHPSSPNFVRGVTLALTCWNRYSRMCDRQIDGRTDRWIGRLRDVKIDRPFDERTRLYNIHRKYGKRCWNALTLTEIKTFDFIGEKRIHFLSQILPWATEFKRGSPTTLRSKYVDDNADRLRDNFNMY